MLDYPPAQGRRTSDPQVCFLAKQRLPPGRIPRMDVRTRQGVAVAAVASTVSPKERSFARACGVDFGTSNSTVGWMHPGGARLLVLEDERVLLPSVVFFNVEEDRTRVGQAALDDYLAGHEGRLMRSLKSLLGSSLIDGQTEVHGRAVCFRDLLAHFVKELRARAEASARRSFDTAVLGRPVRFVDDDDAADRQAQTTLEEIAHAAGFRELSFELEPIAAAYDHERSLTRETLVLVADIGGGTSDFSLVRLGPRLAARDDRTSDVLGCAGVHVGGTDFDRELNLAGVMPLFGFGRRLKSGREMPSAIFFDLATWHTINRAYTRQTATQLLDLSTDIADTARYARLLRLIERRDGHRLALEVEAAKIALSSKAAHELVFERLEPGLTCTLTRTAFDAAAAALTAKIGAAVDRVLAAAGVRAEQVESVYLTGGASAIPAVQTCIAGRLPSAGVVMGDSFGSIGTGLAVVAARRYGMATS